jgi:hypothetical protein
VEALVVLVLEAELTLVVAEAVELQELVEEVGAAEAVLEVEAVVLQELHQLMLVV